MASLGEQLMVLELVPPPDRPYPPGGLDALIGHPIVVNVEVGGQPFQAPGAITGAELLPTGNLRLTVRLVWAPLN